MSRIKVDRKIINNERGNKRIRMVKRKRCQRIISVFRRWWRRRRERGREKGGSHVLRR